MGGGFFYLPLSASIRLCDGEGNIFYSVIASYGKPRRSLWSSRRRTRPGGTPWRTSRARRRTQRRDIRIDFPYLGISSPVGFLIPFSSCRLPYGDIVSEI